MFGDGDFADDDGNVIVAVDDELPRAGGDALAVIGIAGQHVAGIDFGFDGGLDRDRPAIADQRCAPEHIDTAVRADPWQKGQPVARLQPLHRSACQHRAGGSGHVTKTGGLIDPEPAAAVAAARHRQGISADRDAEGRRVETVQCILSGVSRGLAKLRRVEHRQDRVGNGNLGRVAAKGAQLIRRFAAKGPVGHGAQIGGIGVLPGAVADCPPQRAVDDAFGRQGAQRVGFHRHAGRGQARVLIGRGKEELVFQRAGRPGDLGVRRRQTHSAAHPAEKLADFQPRFVDIVGQRLRIGAVPPDAVQRHRAGRGGKADHRLDPPRRHFGQPARRRIRQQFQPARHPFRRAADGNGATGDLCALRGRDGGKGVVAAGVQQQEVQPGAGVRHDIDDNLRVDRLRLQILDRGGRDRGGQQVIAPADLHAVTGIIKHRLAALAQPALKGGNVGQHGGLVAIGGLDHLEPGLPKLLGNQLGVIGRIGQRGDVDIGRIADDQSDARGRAVQLLRHGQNRQDGCRHGAGQPDQTLVG